MMEMRNKAMSKIFLLKTVILIMVLVTVLVVIVTAMRVDLGSSGTEKAHAQTLFEQFVISGGPIVWFVLLPLSLVMVYLAVEHGLTIRRKKLLPQGIGTTIVAMARRFDPAQLLAGIGSREDFVSTAVLRAITQGRDDWFRMRNLLFESLQDQALALGRRIEWLKLIGNVSPMVGLFGTVFGMIKLFDAIVIAGGQPQPAQLAEGISVALVTTFWGMFIAIPALTIHGIFQNRIEVILSDAITEAENIMPQIGRSLKEQQKQQQQIDRLKQKQPIYEIPSKSPGTMGRSVPLK